jgi:membrane protease subunit HflK
VTRERLYLETMQTVYSNVTKVMVDSRQNNNMLYLPLDKLMQMAASEGGVNAPSPAAAPATLSSTPSAPSPAVLDSRTRDTGRTRDRDTR